MEFNFVAGNRMQWHGKTVHITIPMQFSDSFFYYTSTVIKSKCLRLMKN